MDFKGNDHIKIQTNTIKNLYGFHFAPAESIEQRGAIPYGRQVQSATVICTKLGETITDLIDSYMTVADDTVMIKLSYPTEGNGYYNLTFTLTLDDGSVYEYDFTNRIRVQD